LRDFTRWLERTQTSGVVIGGVAASLLGRPRYTRDIDALVLLEEKSWAEFLSSAAKFGFQPRRTDALQFARKTRVLLLRHAASGIELDVSVGSLPFEKELVARAVWKDVAGVRTPLPTVEDLIIMKAVAHRARDLYDIESLVAVHARLDVRRIERWVKEFANALEMPEIFSDLQTILKRRPSSHAR
jgi:predicted nucleotidyltransferase